MSPRNVENWASLSQTGPHSKNFLALNRVTPSKSKISTQIFTNTYLAAAAYHKLNYTGLAFTLENQNLALQN